MVHGTTTRNCTPLSTSYARATSFIYKFDRLGRLLRSLIAFVGDLRERGVRFNSVSDAIDTATPAEGFFFHVLAALAEVERDLIRERTQAGRCAARACGRNGGRQPKLTPQQVAKVQRMIEKCIVTVTEVAGKFRVNGWTIYGAWGIAGQG